MHKYFIALVFLALNIAQVTWTMQSSQRAFKYEKRKLQHVFDRHKEDFGMDKKWNKDTQKEFEQTLCDHVQNPQTSQILGTYRGKIQAVHYLASATSVNVTTSPKGSLIAGWKLDAKQVDCVQTTGNLQ